MLAERHTDGPIPAWPCLCIRSTVPDKMVRQERYYLILTLLIWLLIYGINKEFHSKINIVLMQYNRAMS